jgi:hypothetical protein
LSIACGLTAQSFAKLPDPSPEAKATLSDRSERLRMVMKVAAFQFV